MKMVLLAFLLVISTLSTLAQAAEVCYLRKVENSILHLTPTEPSKDEQVQLLKKNPQMFCEKNLELRYLNVNPGYSKMAGFTCQATRDEIIDSIVNQTLFFEVRSFGMELGGSGYQPWFSSLIPTQFAQNITLGNSNPRSYFSEANSGPEQSAYSTFSKTADQYRINFLKNMTDIFSKAPNLTFNESSVSNFLGRAHKKNSSGIEDSIAAQTALCADLGMSNTVSCVRALNRALEIAKPYFFEKMSYMPMMVWEKLFTNEKFYAEGLRRAALKVIGRLQNNKRNLGFILDDLTSSFMEAGLSKDQSLDAAYDVLALYGNGGANLGERLDRLSIFDWDFRATVESRVSSKNCNALQNSVCGYLNIIAKAIPVLDYESLRDHGALYSLPKAANSRCNNQKSYYFWLNAFLARQLLKEGLDAKSAALGAYALSIGYQFNRDQGVKNGQISRDQGDKKIQIFGAKALFRSSYDPVNNIIRTDLATAYAGGAFGAENKIISVDETLVKLMLASTPVAPQVETFDPASKLDQASKYLLFRKLISPSAALE